MKDRGEEKQALADLSLFEPTPTCAPTRIQGSAGYSPKRPGLSALPSENLPSFAVRNGISGQKRGTVVTVPLDSLSKQSELVVNPTDVIVLLRHRLAVVGPLASVPSEAHVSRTGCGGGRSSASRYTNVVPEEETTQDGIRSRVV